MFSSVGWGEAALKGVQMANKRVARRYAPHRAISNSVNTVSKYLLVPKRKPVSDSY